MGTRPHRSSMRSATHTSSAVARVGLRSSSVCRSAVDNLEACDGVRVRGRVRVGVRGRGRVRVRGRGRGKELRVSARQGITSNYATRSYE